MAEVTDKNWIQIALEVLTVLAKHGVTIADLKQLIATIKALGAVADQ